MAISFVRAVDMDRWSEDLVSLTLAGGNRRFDEFLRHKKVSKPIAYQKGEMEPILDEYRSLLQEDSKKFVIRQLIEQFKKQNNIQDESI